MIHDRAKRGHKIAWLAGIILTLAITGAAWGKLAFASERPDSASLPVKLNIRLMRTLERQLSDIERALVEQAKIAQVRVCNVTMPLQNRLDDVILASGWYTDIYPRAMYEVLVAEFKTSKPKSEIADLLIAYQSNGRFKRLAESQESKKPSKGKAGS